MAIFTTLTLLMMLLGLASSQNTLSQCEDENCQLTEVQALMAQLQAQFTAELSEMKKELTEIKQKAEKEYQRLAHSLNNTYGFTATPELNGWKTYWTYNIIEFSRVLSNIGGAYDPISSRFTCPVHGMYVFQVSVLGGDGHTTAYASLSVNRILHLLTYAQGANGTYGHATVAVVVECDVGNKVHVQAGHNTEIYGVDYNSFSGWLVKVISI